MQTEHWLLFGMFFVLLTLQYLSNKKTLSIQTQTIDRLSKENLDLRNRLISGDLHTYQAMMEISQTNYSPRFDDLTPVSMSDEAEAERMEKLYGVPNTYEQDQSELDQMMNDLVGDDFIDRETR